MAFPHKKFEGISYTFDHLNSFSFVAELNAAKTITATIDVSFRCHCFTEEFKNEQHSPGHLYTYNNEQRAFDLTRYQASLHLPAIIRGMIRGNVYLAGRKNYTYVAQMAGPDGQDKYSLFFELKPLTNLAQPGVRMVVQSAYYRRNLAAPKNAETWRFGSLVGQIAGIFPPSSKGPKPQPK